MSKFKFSLNEPEPDPKPVVAEDVVVAIEEMTEEEVNRVKKVLDKDQPSE